ncbi:hypothetical protein A2685_00455 [Candidatus Woesebacteria bacterium RIFCSPHIGHO2_01_FULL_37_10]|uniref:peptidylprolyl isomerase n=1 Tax=Candidatus Woesebacteria bacterium RIFCSPHIGHO2_01_FULL_37_10 TaxID=1802489 RepID=A0A1F7XWI8_9BACT|nr:MAG: hypothetical protein A2685_00455 [Candidatus Woesebacteria bacterium RIFCSPHIGHO2_01_FULL_37_10]
MAAKRKTTKKFPGSEVTSAEKSEKKVRKIKFLGSYKKPLVVTLVVIILISLAYVSKSVFFAAFVNGKPISRLGIVRDLEKSYGQQMLDNLVTKELINQEATKKGITISEEDINKEIGEIEKAVQAQGTTLDEALATQGQSREDLNENVRIQKTIEKLLAEDITVNEDELKKYFEENKDYYKDAEYADIEPTIREQLKQQKLQGSYQKWIEDLKSTSRINYFVSY